MTKPANWEKHFEVHLPVPPSTNQLYIYAGSRKRIKSDKYRLWTRIADNLIVRETQGATFLRAKTSYSVTIIVPWDNRRDLDNYCKATLDALQRCNIIPNDNKIEQLSVSRNKEYTNMLVTVLTQ